MRVTWARPSLPWASCPGAARQVGPVCRGRGGRLPLRKCASWGPAAAAAGIGRGWAPRPPGFGQRPRCPPQRGAAPPQPVRPGSVPLTSLDPAFVHACLPAPAATLASLPREHHRAPAPPASAPPSGLRGPFSLLHVSAHGPPHQKRPPPRGKRHPGPGPGSPLLRGPRYFNMLLSVYLLPCVSFPRRPAAWTRGLCFNLYQIPGAWNSTWHIVGVQ